MCVLAREAVGTSGALELSSVRTPRGAGAVPLFLACPNAKARVGLVQQQAAAPNPAVLRGVPVGVASIDAAATAAQEQHDDDVATMELATVHLAPHGEAMTTVSNGYCSHTFVARRNL